MAHSYCINDQVEYLLYLKINFESHYATLQEHGLYLSVTYSNVPSSLNLILFNVQIED